MKIDTAEEKATLGYYDIKTPNRIIQQTLPRQFPDRMFKISVSLLFFDKL